MFYAILTYSHPDILVENVILLKGDTLDQARAYAVDHCWSDFMPDPHTGHPDCEKLEIIEVVGSRIEIDMVKAIQESQQQRQLQEQEITKVKELAELARLKAKYQP